MELYDYFRSSASFRVRIGLNLKGLSPERRFIHLTRDGGEQFGSDFTKLNPQQLVPVLVDEGEAFTQSLAILEYLDETHPEPPFLPKDAAGRARVRALALSIACDLHPLNNLRVLFYLKDQMDQPEEARNAWYRHWVAKGLEALEGALAGGVHTGDFCHGDVPGLADICLVPQIFNAKRFDCTLDAYPVVMRVFETCMAHSAFDAAQPAKQPDAE
ncbi:MAG: maleylacetoacetate isomerase [Alphaproteobacteria bacterium]|jgi:maleylacetoacetate isomerase